MPRDDAKELYIHFLKLLKDNYKQDKIQCGIFGEYMEVESLNDGP